MNKSLALKNKIYLFFSLIITLFVTFYFIFFLINGPRGIISYFKILNKNSYDILMLESLNQENNLLLNKIDRLTTNKLDLDFLDEKIREKTGFIDKDELLIIFD